LLAPIRSLEVGKLTFHVRTPWGLMRHYLHRLAEIEASAAGEKAREAAIEEATRELLTQIIVGWEGAYDADGQPLPWQPDLLDQLDAAVIAELLRRLAEPPAELGTKKDPPG
jgi:hypothetical protein